MQPLLDPFSEPVPDAPIAFVTHEFAPFHGGVATYVKETATAAYAGGTPVVIWTVDRHLKPEAGSKNRDDNVNNSSFGPPLVRLSSNGRLTPAGLLSFAWGLWRGRRAWRDRPVVLLSVGAQMAFFLLAAVGVQTGKRTVCFFHGSEVLRFRRNPFWRKLARRFYRRNAVGFAAVTPYVAGLLRESGLLPERGVEIAIAVGALPSVFHVAQDREANGTMEVSGDTYRVLTVARLHPRKGQLEVARALALLPEAQRKRVVYQVVGTGEEVYRRRVEAACRQGGVRCEFLGAVDDVTLRTIYVKATVYAQASQTLAQSVEGFGITFLEAAASGCPAAAWRSGGVATAVFDGETGLLVDEGDLPGLATAIGRLLAEPELRRRMGERGRAFAREFSWERSALVLCEQASAAGRTRRSL